jgi:hypothetical protein
LLMHVLLDECLPRRLRVHLPGHDLQTVQEKGWSGKKNGELLTLAAEAGFGALITVDQSLQYQQNVRRCGLGVVALAAESNRLQDLLPLVSAVMSALESIRPGEYVEIGLKDSAI